MTDKIQATHLVRQAAVYLRQSTMRQVYEHRESTERQYNLKQRAVELGWRPDQVVVLDEDLGQSGGSAEDRPGFQRLAEEVAHGRIGAIFALEASRLARHSADWHRLLDLCRLADVIIADDQAVYAPCRYDDQLLLGLKGTMAEAELVWMRLRLQGGKLNKARRGALYQNPPVGYVWDPQRHRFTRDPDEHVQQAVRLVFERFLVEGSARGVLRYFARHGLRLPGPFEPGGKRSWRPPSYASVLSMLRNPTYTGAYTYGRTEERRALVNGVVQQRRLRRIPLTEWKVLLRDHHPAYIEWEEFMANQQKLDENQPQPSTPESRGAARNGEALLQGLVLCGRCGSWMTVRYQQADRGYATYQCRGRGWQKGEGGSCWSVSSRRIDEAVVAQMFDAVAPAQLELGLAVAMEAEHQASVIDQQWKLRFERLEYEARLAERRYKAIDPDNRVVARTLERDWELRLREVEDARLEYAELRRRLPVEIGEKDQARILALSKDLRNIWNAPTTTNTDRKNLLRLVIRQVGLSPVDVPQRSVNVRILWESGVVTEHRIPRPRVARTFAAPAEAEDMIRKGYESGWDDTRLATELNAHGLLTGRGRHWDEQAVAQVRRRLDLHRPKGPPAFERSDGLTSARGVAARFGVHVETVHWWVEHGWLQPAEEGGHGRPNWYRLDAATIASINARRHR